jgi:hypothetical protein
MIGRLALLGLFAAAPVRLDLNPHGIFATVEVPAGAKAPRPQRDGAVYLELDGQNFVFINRQRLNYSEHKATLISSGQTLTVDRVEPNGEFTLGWNDATPGRRSLFHALDQARLTCTATGTDVERAAAVCRSLRPKRVGEVLRVVAEAGPTVEKVDGRWKLAGLLRVEQDGLAVPGAQLRINGVVLQPSRRHAGALELALDDANPGMVLKLEYQASGARGSTELPCPGEARILRPRDASSDSPGTVQWTVAPSALKHSVSVVSWDPREKLALPGGTLGWASATDDLMSIAVSGKPPFQVTLTAYGPEAKGAQVPFLSCRVVHRVRTLLDGAK